MTFVNYNDDHRKQARKLRLFGYSYQEIGEKLKVARSTAFLWSKSINPNKNGQKRLDLKNKTKLEKLFQRNKLRIENKKNLSQEVTHQILNSIKLDENLSKLICALLYWGEGSKTGYSIAFTNSDPKMIATFLHALRKAYPLNENKFRLLMQLHEYHNEDKTKNFWSELTKIPTSQFNKTYVKPNSTKIKRKDYLGTIRIKYYDAKIVREIKTIYNTLAMKLGS